MREVRVICRAVKSELQDPRSGHVQLVAECANARRDQPQVLSDERERP
jgi:hypothetical protein